MKAIQLGICLLLAVGSSAISGEKPHAYDFRESRQYKALSDVDRTRLETVHRDLTVLWGALDRYHDHYGRLPESLDELVPAYLREVPVDPFATDGEQHDEKQRKRKTYRYVRGNGESWVISSVGLPDFPYLAARDNVGLYLAKGYWSGGASESILGARGERSGVFATVQDGKPVVVWLQAGAIAASAPVEFNAWGPVVRGKKGDQQVAIFFAKKGLVRLEISSALGLKKAYEAEGMDALVKNHPEVARRYNHWIKMFQQLANIRLGLPQHEACNSEQTHAGNRRPIVPLDENGSF